MKSSKFSGQNVSAVKAQNVKAILMHLLHKEPVYRVDLARDISVSTTTVTKLIDELIDQGIVQEGVVEVEGERPVGRPKSALFLNKNAYYAIAVHIGGSRYRIGIVNLRDEIISFYKTEYDFSQPCEELLEEICDQLNKMINESGIERNKIIGIGIGVPGIVDAAEGVIGYSKNHGWKDVQVKDFFTSKFDCQIAVENNVRAMALGEALFGDGRTVDNLLFIYGSRGVGAGIVVDRKILRGISQGAGEIGHTYLICNDGSKSISESSSTLEDLISVSALINESKAIIDQNPQCEFSNKLYSLDGNELVEAVFELAKEGDPNAKKIIEKISRFLGIAILNAINFINPELILLGGLYAEYENLFIPRVREMADNLTFANIGRKVDIRATEFGWRAGLFGAGALALSQFFYLPPENIEG